MNPVRIPDILPPTTHSLTGVHISPSEINLAAKNSEGIKSTHSMKGLNSISRKKFTLNIGILTVSVFFPNLASGKTNDVNGKEKTNTPGLAESQETVNTNMYLPETVMYNDPQPYYFTAGESGDTITSTSNGDGHVKFGPTLNGPWISGCYTFGEQGPDVPGPVYILGDIAGSGAEVRIEGSNGILKGTEYIAVEMVTPVVLASNELYLNDDNQPVMTWTTASEINNDRFEIERSSDGVRFEKVGELKGAGNSHAKNNYSFTDETPLATGTYYYKLKQVDYDGQEAFFNVKVVTIENTKTEAQLDKNPLARGEDIVVHVFRESDQDIRLVNVSTGQVVYTGKATLGENRISTNGLASGMYIVEITAGERIKVVIK